MKGFVGGIKDFQISLHQFKGWNFGFKSLKVRIPELELIPHEDLIGSRSSEAKHEYRPSRIIKYKIANREQRVQG